MAKVKHLRQRHPEYREERFETIAALYEGGALWDAHKPKTFPKNNAEPPDVYADRLKLAKYFNYFGGLLNLAAGDLFSEPTQLDGGGAYWESLEADADGRGTDWDTWWMATFLDSLLFRRTFAWVNTPDVRDEPEPQNLGEQTARGDLDARLVRISGEHAIDWGEDTRGALEWLMVEQRDFRRPGPDSPAIAVWTWTWFGVGEIRRWEWSDPEGKRAEPADEDEAQEQKPAKTAGLAVVRLQMPVGVWMGDKLHDPALGLTRMENALDWALDKAAHALLYIKSKWGTDRPVLGSGYYMELAPEDEIGYAEPTGASFEIIRNRVKDLREELHRVVAALAMGLDSSASRHAQSGESKKEDRKPSEILLSAYATIVLDAMTRVGLVVQAIRKDEPPEFGGLHTGEDEGTDAFLERAAMSIDAAKLSDTFVRLVARRQAIRVLGDEVSPEDMEVVLAEIEAATIERMSMFAEDEEEEEEEEEEDE